MNSNEQQMGPVCIRGAVWFHYCLAISTARILCALAALVIVIVYHLLVSFTPIAHASDRHENELRQRTACGPNSLYLFLKLRGRPVTYAQVEREFAVEEGGTSLLELREAARRLGLDAEVRHCSMDDLGQCSMPVIAHLNRKYAPSSAIGHYVVVLAVDEHGVLFIDGTTGQKLRFTLQGFPIFWSGYVLGLREADTAWERRLTFGCVIFWTVLAFLLSMRMSASKSRVLVRSGAAALFLYLSASGVCFPVQAAEERAASPRRLEFWRTPEADGVNCLYLQLCILQRPVRYADVKEAIQPLKHSQGISLLSLKEAARCCGLRTKIHKCNPIDLADLPMPVIAHMDYARGNGGHFVLLYRPGDEKHGLIEGTTAEIKEMPIDEFRRDWSGYVLVPDSNDNYRMVSVGAGFVVAASYFWWRLAYRPKCVVRS